MTLFALGTTQSGVITTLIKGITTRFGAIATLIGAIAADIASMSVTQSQCRLIWLRSVLKSDQCLLTLERSELLFLSGH